MGLTQKDDDFSKMKSVFLSTLRRWLARRWRNSCKNVPTTMWRFLLPHDRSLPSLFGIAHNDKSTPGLATTASLIYKPPSSQIALHFVHKLLIRLDLGQIGSFIFALLAPFPKPLLGELIRIVRRQPLPTHRSARSPRGIGSRAAEQGPAMRWRRRRGPAATVRRPWLHHPSPIAELAPLHRHPFLFGRRRHCTAMSGELL